MVVQGMMMADGGSVQKVWEDKAKMHKQQQLKSRC